MATKKRTKHRRKPSSGGGSPRRHVKRRRKRKGSLSSASGLHTLAINSFKHTLSAATGGFAAVYINKWMPATWGKPGRILATLGVGIAGAYFGMPVLSAGAVGGMVAMTFPNGTLNDGEENFADNDVLSDMPLFLDDDGRPMVLEEGQDGSSGFRYLSDAEATMLAEQGAFEEADVEFIN